MTARRRPDKWQQLREWVRDELARANEHGQPHGAPIFAFEAFGLMADEMDRLSPPRRRARKETRG